MHALFDLIGAVALVAWGLALLLLAAGLWSVLHERRPPRPRHAPPPRPIHMPGVRQLSRDLAASAEDARRVEQLLADDDARWRARFAR